MSVRHALLMLAFVAIAAPAAATESAAESARELRICVDPDNPPLSLNRAGAQPGIDVEVGQAIAERLDSPEPDMGRYHVRRTGAPSLAPRRTVRTLHGTAR